MKPTFATLAVLAAASIASHASAQTGAPAPAAQKGTAAPAATETLSSGVGIKHLAIGTGTSPRHPIRSRCTTAARWRTARSSTVPTSAASRRCFRSDRVVPCWTQALQKLKVGGKATLTCPPSTAYGARGIPNVIPPDSTLTFDVELLSIDG